jgi:hypothetical protein
VQVESTQGLLSGSLHAHEPDIGFQSGILHDMELPSAHLAGRPFR